VSADLALTGARVIDPKSGFDGPATVLIRDDRIVAIDRECRPPAAERRIDLSGAILSPGLIDVHVHVYEWVTNFGLNADDTGVNAGATTVVDQGSAGCWTFGGFKAHVIDKSVTDVRSFPSINVAGALKGGMEGRTLHNPGMVALDDLTALAKAYPRHVRGIKCHGESGALSYWGVEVLKLAAEAGRRTGLPLYCHTGELFPVEEKHRPRPDTVLPQVLPLLKPGDVLAHVYSCMPDGIFGPGSDVPEWIFEARRRGIRFDIGHGINFSFRIARAMMAAGILPFTVSSDAHGDFTSYHDLRILDYSLAGAINKLVALGIPLMEVLRSATANPAELLVEAGEIGTIAAGARADLTVLDRVTGPFTFYDAEGATLEVKERLIPRLVVRAGKVIEPHLALVPDVVPERSRAAGVGQHAPLAQKLAA
jgi:dihydroorotase